tara:strand:- start:65 stop:553 length:489 start_codon:yes stop_codon:yes gene_type:complete
MAVIGNNNLISMWYMETDYWANRSSNQWGEISSAYRLTVTPKRSDSKIVFECSLPNQTVTHHGLNHYRIYNVTDSAVVNEPQAHVNRSRDHAPSRGQYNADNVTVVNIRVIGDSFSGSKVFTIQSHSWNNDTTRHNHSQGNSNFDVHFSTNMVFLAYEIEDI